MTKKIHGKQEKLSRPGLIIISGKPKASQKLESGLVQAVVDPNITEEESRLFIEALRRDPVINIKPR